MPDQVFTLRSTVPGARPAGRDPGELYVNFPDQQIGVVDESAAPVDLVAVRFFSATASYTAGDHTVQGGKLYRAIVAVNPGDFSSTQWEQIGGSVTVSDAPPAIPQPGQLWFDSVGGQLYVYFDDGTSQQWVIAVNNTPSMEAFLTSDDAATTYLALTGGAMTGPMNLAADPIAPLQPASKRYVDTKAGSSTPVMDGTAAVGSALTWARADHVHPTDTSRAPVAGVTDGSNAAAGQIGEVISNVITTVVVLTTGVTSVVGQINLTPGDWDVCGEVWVNVVGASLTFAVASINQAGQGMAAAPLMGGARTQVVPAISAGNTQVLSLRTCRVSLTTATTYSLFAQSIFTGGGCNTTGVIWARRAR